MEDNKANFCIAKHKSIILHDSSDDGEELEANIGSPIACILYDFLTDPNSSRYAKIWSIFTCILVLTRMLAIGLQSCDGPNQYYHQPEDLSLYPFLLSAPSYWNLYIAVMTPLIIDGCIRIAFLLLISLEPENHPIWLRFKVDYLEIFLFLSDIIGLIPFFTMAAYYHPRNLTPDRVPNVILNVLELLLNGRIHRAVKKVPSIRAIAIALSNAAPHLALPTFFFFVFNITTVTMTTTGYGNQVPPYELSRFIACLVMLFGALFLSMPLAIIGNEYDRAWTTVTNDEQHHLHHHKEHQQEEEVGVEEEEDEDKGRFPLDPQQQLQDTEDVPTAILTFEQKKALLLQTEPTLLTIHHIHTHCKHLNSDYDNHHHHITHSTILALCELKAWLPCLSININQIMTVIRALSSRSSCQQQQSLPGYSSSSSSSNDNNNGRRRLSVFGGRGVISTIPNNHSQSQLQQSQQQQSQHISIKDPRRGSVFGTNGMAARPTTFLLPQQLQLQLRRHSLAAIVPAPPAPVIMNIHHDLGVRRSNMKKMLSSIIDNDHEDDDKDNNISSKANCKKDDKNRLLHEGHDEDIDSHYLSPSSSDEGSDDDNHHHKHNNSDHDPSTNTTIKRTVTEGGEGYDEDSENYELSSDSDEDDENNHHKHNNNHTTTNAINNTAENNKEKEIPEEKTTNLDTTTTATITTTTSKMEMDTNISNQNPTTNNSHSTSIRPTEEAVSPPSPLSPAIKTKSRGRTSIYIQLLSVIGVEDSTARNRTLTEDFVDRMEKVSTNPTSYRSRLWILLELPSSSREARFLQGLLILLISISIFTLYTQTATSLTHYGESTAICGRLLSLYCSDKEDSRLDPGCFVNTINNNGSTMIQTNMSLQFNCDHNNCFGHGLNFGAPPPALHNSSQTNVYPLSCVGPNPIAPFQDQDQLLYKYGPSTVFFSRLKMHQSNPICSRIECIDNSDTFVPGAGEYWLIMEFLINAFFTIELILRLSVADSLYLYWKDKMNVFDMLAILPFYAELFSASISKAGFASIDFSILSSSPDPLFLVYVRSLKVFRMFKLTRHFRASKVLIETARRIWRQIVGMLMLLAFLVFLFAIIIFVLERGRACYVGDNNCPVPEESLPGLRIGEVVYLTKGNKLSVIPDVFYGVWFSFVTITTTGYGDIVPVTDAGQLAAIFLMIAGQFYMAMPLTAAATTFYTIHEQYTEDNNHVQEVVVASANNNKGDEAGQQQQPIGEQQQQLPTVQVIDSRLQLSIQNILNQLQQHEKSLTAIVSDIHSSPFSLFDVDRLSALAKESKEKQDIDKAADHDHHHDNKLSPLKLVSHLRKKIISLCKELEDCLQGSERDIVELMFKYHQLLHGGDNSSSQQQS